jgi:hypothetical protein
VSAVEVLAIARRHRRRRILKDTERKMDERNMPNIFLSAGLPAFSFLPLFPVDENEDGGGKLVHPHRLFLRLTTKKAHGLFA